jgi:hypothetical protein
MVKEVEEFREVQASLNGIRADIEDINDSTPPDQVGEIMWELHGDTPVLPDDVYMPFYRILVRMQGADISFATLALLYAPDDMLRQISRLLPRFVEEDLLDDESKRAVLQSRGDLIEEQAESDPNFQALQDYLSTSTDNARIQNAGEDIAPEELAAWRESLPVEGALMTRQEAAAGMAYRFPESMPVVDEDVYNPLSTDTLEIDDESIGSM